MTSGFETTVAESELQRGLDCGELHRVYQPVVDLTNGEPRYVEALLRWEHPARGLLSPQDFFVQEEDSTLLVRVGWSVVIEAARRAGDWRRRHPDRPITVSVNLSEVHLAARDLPSRVDHLLRDNEVPGPHALAFEIGEYALSAPRARYRDRLFGLRNLGLEIVVDDFGTAVAATEVAADVIRDSTVELLESLGQFPLDVIKIAPWFVARLTTGDGRPEFLADVVTAAHAAGLRVLALAVETETDVALAAGAHVDLAQGFFFSRPVSPDSVDTLLALS
jgi:EAL domain-containing protein (putative c-di-GMP-specific phosphodiesterase class I)